MHRVVSTAVGVAGLTFPYGMPLFSMSSGSRSSSSFTTSTAATLVRKSLWVWVGMREPVLVVLVRIRNPLAQVVVVGTRVLVTVGFDQVSGFEPALLYRQDFSWVVPCAVSKLRGQLRPASSVLALKEPQE